MALAANLDHRPTFYFLNRLEGRSLLFALPAFLLGCVDTPLYVVVEFLGNNVDPVCLLLERWNDSKLFENVSIEIERQENKRAEGSGNSLHVLVVLLLRSLHNFANIEFVDARLRLVVHQLVPCCNDSLDRLICDTSLTWRLPVDEMRDDKELRKRIQLLSVLDKLLSEQASCQIVQRSFETHTRVDHWFHASLFDCREQLVVLGFEAIHSIQEVGTAPVDDE